MPLFSLSSPKCSYGTLITFASWLIFLLIVNSSTVLHTPNPLCNDPYKQLNLIKNPNGTVTRPNKSPESPPSLDPSLPVISKDLTINQSKGTWARIYLPRKALDHSSKKLPLVVFFHGGGFIFLSAASTIFHVFCFNMANDVEAVVVSIEYRLAPEHRLPAAYDDAVEALHWIKTNREDDWLIHHVDFSNVLLMGSSAGGNIAYNTALRVAAGDDDQLSMIKGLILVQPFFGGTVRTGSELRLENDSHLSLCTNDMLWELSLPVGVNRDYEYCNPAVGNGPVRLEEIKRLGWRILVTGCKSDPLADRQAKLVKLLEKKGVRVVGLFTEGGYHGVQDSEPLKAKKLFGVITSFISSLNFHP